MTTHKKHGLAHLACNGDFGGSQPIGPSATVKLMDLSRYGDNYTERPQLLAIGIFLDVNIDQSNPTGTLLVRANLTWATGGGQMSAAVDVVGRGTMVVVPAADGLQLSVTREGDSTLDASAVQARATVGVASSPSGLAQRTQVQALPFTTRLPIPRFARELRTYISTGNLRGDEVRFFPDQAAGAMVTTAAPEIDTVTIPNGANFWDMNIAGPAGGRIVQAVWGLTL